MEEEHSLLAGCFLAFLMLVMAITLLICGVLYFFARGVYIILKAVFCRLRKGQAVPSREERSAHTTPIQRPVDSRQIGSAFNPAVRLDLEQLFSPTEGGEVGFFLVCDGKVEFVPLNPDLELFRFILETCPR